MAKKRYNVWIHFEEVTGTGTKEQHKTRDDLFMPIKIGTATGIEEAQLVFGRLENADFVRFFGIKPPVTEAYSFIKGDVFDRFETIAFDNDLGEMELTDKDAYTILEMMSGKADISIGISWETLDYFIEKFLEYKGILVR